MRQATGCAVRQSTLKILESSWRRGTRRQHQSASKSWSTRCRDKSLDPTTVYEEASLHYPQFLFDKGFAWRMTNLHRLAISSALEPHLPNPVGQHPLVRRFVKGVLNERPPPSRVVPTWNVDEVRQFLRQLHPAGEISLAHSTQKVMFLLAVCTARRVSDLLLFSVHESL